ncbi:MAG TPA: hypothetical protein VJB06_01060, partial [archaeon]|nr:hypothetical protein [archaeon]
MERNRIIMPDNPETGGVATITPDNTPRVEDRPETSEAGRTPTENRIPDPENTHDTFTYIDEGLARIQKEQIAQTKANSRFQNALEMAESDPAIKRAIEENRIAYFNRLLDEERRQLEGSDGQGRVRGRRERLREPNEDEEIIPVKTNLGTLREDIILPKDPERKLDY